MVTAREGLDMGRSRDAYDGFDATLPKSLRIPHRRASSKAPGQDRSRAGPVFVQDQKARVPEIHVVRAGERSEFTRGECRTREIYR